MIPPVFSCLLLSYHNLIGCWQSKRDICMSGLSSYRDLIGCWRPMAWLEMANFEIVWSEHVRRKRTKQEAAVVRFHGTRVLGWLAFTVISSKLLNCKFHSWSQIQELFSWFLRIQGKVFARPLIYSRRTRSRIIYRRVVSLSERFVLNRTLTRILLILQV